MEGRMGRGDTNIYIYEYMSIHIYASKGVINSIREERYREEGYSSGSSGSSSSSSSNE